MKKAAAKILLIMCFIFIFSSRCWNEASRI